MTRLRKWPLLALVASVLTLGVGRTWTLVRSTMLQAENVLDENLGDKAVESIIRVKLQDFDGQLRAHQTGLAKLEARHAAVQSDIRDKERRLEGENHLLKRARELLGEGRASYVISGVTVSRDQLSADAEVRLLTCERLEEGLALQRKVALELAKSVDRFRASLLQAQRMRQHVIGELETARARLATARTRQEVNELSAALGGLPSFGSDSELGRALQRLRDRAREAEADVLALEATNGGLIDWQQRDELTLRIEHFLAKPNKKK